MSHASGVLVYQVPNRGHADIGGSGYFADFRATGHVLVASGWQADIPPAAGMETLVTPVAKNPDGSSVTGPVMARFVDMPAGSMSLPMIRGRVTGTAMPATLETSKATLTRRTSEGGSRVPIDDGGWTFADCSHKPFPGTPDPAILCLRGGFDRNFLYELTYIAKDPPVHGIGFAATRDLVSFLRRDSTGNPLGAAVHHAIAQGNSQSGNYLRSFVHLGFNQDERGRRVFDGMNTNIAARQLAMNIRFAPSGAAEMYEPGSEEVLWWGDYTDEARERAPSSLLTRCRTTDTCPIPRLSIEERYGTHDAYVTRVRAAARRLVDEGFLLHDDAERLIEQAANSQVLR